MVQFLDLEKNIQFFDKKKQYSYLEVEISGHGILYFLNADNKSFPLDKKVYDELIVKHPEHS